MIATLERPLLSRPALPPLREALAPALRSGALPLAARSAILCAVCLWVGLLTLELVADNHERALALHELQRDLVAREAINQRLSFLAESHVPGVGTQVPEPSIEGVRAPASAVARQTLTQAANGAKTSNGAKAGAPQRSSAAPKANPAAKPAAKNGKAGSAKPKPASDAPTASAAKKSGGGAPRGRSGVL